MCAKTINRQTKWGNETINAHTEGSGKRERMSSQTPHSRQPGKGLLHVLQDLLPDCRTQHVKLEP